MTMLVAGHRVRLGADLVLSGSVTLAEGAPAEKEAVAGSLALAAGLEGTVDRVYEDQAEPPMVREYVRLKSLLDDYGHQMPPESRKRLEDEVSSLEPEWAAFQQRRLRVTVRVRLDNGFVLDDVPGDVFVPASG
ncbi:hypothetical protein [Streptomyces griseosporeus]|uniref:hypothetical protein n=1 Tax=Streptomyces griseosporeus TaxID=1910 RepID=UPI00167DF4D1|nr:hypothetical protein [Streptomyces griseosporeus]GHF51437.1 hypothetical protein GCM10018783_20060 [Streptomyces griseosporeus]